MQTFQCAPYPACVCMLWDVRPNETVPLQIDWTGLLASVDGFKLASIEAASLTNMMANPPAPADPAEIDLVSGLGTDPGTGWPGYTLILGENNVTMNMIKTGANVPVGKVFRFDISLGLMDCNGRKIIINDCVSISVHSGH
jgi:hypothetical protein